MWTSASSPITIILGASDGTTSQFSVTNDGHCSDAFAYYCLGIDHDFAVAPIPETGKLAFVSNTAFAPGATGGLAKADQLCQSNATAAGKTGTFLAFLSTKQQAALSRFSRFRRPRGCGSTGWRRRPTS
jgi:hypothetical protein